MAIFCYQLSAPYLPMSMPVEYPLSTPRLRQPPCPSWTHGRSQSLLCMGLGQAWLEQCQLTGIGLLDLCDWQDLTWHLTGLDLTVKSSLIRGSLGNSSLGRLRAVEKSQLACQETCQEASRVMQWFLTVLWKVFGTSDALHQSHVYLVLESEIICSFSQQNLGQTLGFVFKK